MNHLVHDRVLHMTFGEESILTQEDTVFGREASGARWRTGMALNGIGGEGTSCDLEMFQHENHGRTYRHKEIRSDCKPKAVFTHLGYQLLVIKLFFHFSHNVQSPASRLALSLASLATFSSGDKPKPVN
jgi:hypothetical protein